VHESSLHGWAALIAIEEARPEPGFDGGDPNDAKLELGCGVLEGLGGAPNARGVRSPSTPKVMPSTWFATGPQVESTPMLRSAFFLLLAALWLNGCGDQTGGSGGMGGDGGTSGSGGMGGGFPCTEQGIRDAIAEGGGPHTFDCDGPTTVVTAARIEIDNDVILDGEGNLEVDGNNDHLVLSVLHDITAELRGFAVTGGDAGFAPAGGIANLGVLTIVDSEVAGNQALMTCSGGHCVVGVGAGIRNAGVLTIANSTVSGNIADQAGGGIDNSAGDLTMTNSTISGNTAGDGNGGGILNSTGGTVTMTNCVVSGNIAGGGGGGIANAGALTMTNTTVSGNTATNEGGGILSRGFDSHFIASLTMTSSTVSGNSALSATAVYWEQTDATMLHNLFQGGCVNDGGGAVRSSGYNIESRGDTCGFDQLTDRVNVSVEDLKLGPLADNGGPTMTHALLPGSVAIDHIPKVDCVDADDKPLTEDQRGEARPQGPTCDVGAFELKPQ
jgi:hypothetical protein